MGKDKHRQMCIVYLNLSFCFNHTNSFKKVRQINNRDIIAGDKIVFIN